MTSHDNTLPNAAANVASEPKSLKIDALMHRRLKVEAATRDVHLQVLTEMALMVGLAGLAHTLRYRDSIGSIEARPMDGCLHGKLLLIPDLVTYEGRTLVELEDAFRRAVDEYEANRGRTAA